MVGWRWREPRADNGHGKLEVDDECAEGQKRQGDGRGEEGEEGERDGDGKEHQGGDGVDGAPHAELDAR